MTSNIISRDAEGCSLVQTNGTPTSSLASSDHRNNSTTDNEIIEEGSKPSRGMSEIEEESSGELFEITSAALPLASIREEDAETSSMFSFDFYNRDDVVYVSVSDGKNEEPSIDALLWTLNNAVNPSSTFLFLIHVFPEIKFIPTPLGMLPIDRANPEQRDRHMAQERSKRRAFLQKFLDICSSSRVKADTILIDSSMEANAILNLIPVCKIRKLVLGVARSDSRRSKSKKGSGVAEQILKNAPEFCEVKIICEGKNIALQMLESPSPSARTDSESPNSIQAEEETSNDPFTCGCFKAKAMP